VQRLLPLLNSAAATWFLFVYHITWQASLLAVLVLAVVLLGRRWPSPLRYWLLVLALAKFALPPLLSMPTGLFSHVGPAVKTVPIQASLPTVALPNPTIMDSATPLGGIPVGSVQGKPSGRTKPVAEPQTSAPVLDGKSWLMLLHISGAMVAACGILRSLLALRRTLHRMTEVTDGELQRRFVRLSEQLGLRRLPRLLLSHEPCGPAAFGLLQPVVVLPGTVALLDARALDAILAHELAHHRRHDLWINWVQLALAVVWWFNPVLWVLNRQIRKVREDCCDDLLLAKNVTTGQAYCATLLGAASKLTGRTTAGISLGFGDPLHPLGRRFERIMDHTLRRAPRLSRAGVLFLAVLASVVLPGLRRSDGDESIRSTKRGEPSASKAAADAKDAAPTATQVWPEGATVAGRVLDHRGMPIANAEVLLLGQERIIVDADRRTWFVPEKENPSPPSTRTGKNGAFTITRKQGAADRLAVIAESPLFWVVSRNSLKQADHVDITLPPAGSLAIRCNFPSKPPKLPVMIDLKTFDGIAWNTDSLRFHMSSFSLVNPGETVFDHLAPAQYSVQRFQETKTDRNSALMTGADRRLVKIESAKRAIIHLERGIGQPLSGQVRGLENVELRYAHLTISCLGPEEVVGKDGHRSRVNTAFDVIPITSEGRFTTDPIAPGKYSASLFAVRASTPRLSSQSSDFSGGFSFTVPEKGDMPKVEIVAKPNRPPDLSKVTDLRLRVVDEDGKPLSKLEAMVHTADAGYGLWVEGHDGLVFLGGAWQYRGAALQVLVRADGYASTVARFAGPQRDDLSNGTAAITLRRGQKVQLRFNLPQDMTWPKGTLPEVYFDDLQERLRMMRQPSNRQGNVVPDFNMLNSREVGAGQFEFSLAADTPRFHVAVHAPGFLQFFEAGSFTPADVKNGKLEIDVPRPATLDVSFEPGHHPGTDVPFKSASVDVNWQIQGNRFLNVTSAANSSLTPRLKVTDLAPGRYWVSVRTQPKEESKPLPGTEINVGAFYDQRMLTLKAGQSERIDFRSTPFDPNAFRGTRAAVVHIRTPDGKPAKGRKVSVTYFDDHYGSQTVFSGALPASGDIVLTGITDTAPPSSYPFPAYTVSVDDKRLGSFGFTKEPPTQRFEFSLAPGVGDIAPDLELTSLVSGKPIRLSSLHGKVVFLEFWATWCGPCQEPMAKLNALGEEQSAAWKDRVAIVPVSIDSEQGRVKSHVQQRGWTGLEHFWSGGSNGQDFEAPAARAFVVHGVPEAVLIGRDGRLLWRGHPLDKSNGKDLKSRIEDALR
jgi:beta-lactamase regulating signal transducer with metallopeptidase domain/thiol-disulfide isomerase/thioredoxin